MAEPFDYAALERPNPAQAYLDGLESDDSKKNQRYALDIFAAFLSGGTLVATSSPGTRSPPNTGTRCASTCSNATRSAAVAADDA